MLIGKRIQLRAIEAEDLPLLVKWRNDPNVYKYFFEHEPLSLVMQRRWFESLLQKSDEKLWIIETIRERKAMGTIGLVHIDLRNRKAEIGRILIYDEEYRLGGYGSEAECLVLLYAFEHLGLHRLYCEVFADNERGIQIHKRFGFKEEGKFREYVFKDGKYRDVIYLALLKSEYLSESQPVIAQFL
jgi:UDP-4-amino-4,6-dideoxy-N-acetyl-beta-L-altrosamine N-acetyltransferase